MILFAEVIVKKSLKVNLDYIIPGALSSSVKEGMFVKIPLNRKTVYALVIKIKKDSPISTDKLKNIISLVDDLPPISPPLFELIKWISAYYSAPIGSVVNCAVPSFTMSKSRFQTKDLLLSPDTAPEIELSSEQEKAIYSVKSSLQANKGTTHLLFGVTGSGKTEVFINIAREVLKTGQSVLILVPEIALTPQLKEILEKRLKSKVALFHSSVTSGERNMNWKKTAAGDIKIVLGARSALFAPLQKLGLIVVDEEHEKSFKQEETPRYNARDAAVVRGTLEKCPVILSSATPSLESYYNALKGKYNLLKLTRRPNDIQLSEVEIVDMKHEADALKKGFFFSQKLLNLIDSALSRKEQVILFVNRRGFANMAYCKECAHIIRCRNCSIAMTYHKKSDKLKCHRCDYTKNLSRYCPSCKNKSIRLLGFGTEKAESTLKKIFPQASISRVDSDLVSKKDYLKETWKSFINHKTDILIGTQMIAKGIHNENVTVAGILNADIGLNMPDFRSGENTFQLLTQVAGRSGRGNKKGKVIIQTNAPEHPVISEALKQDYESFADRELKERKLFLLPPLKRMIILTTAHSKEEKAASLAGKTYALLTDHPSFQIFPPTPSPIKQIRSRYRFQIIISTSQIKKTIQSLKEILNSLSTYERSFLTIDVDPQNTL